jgi:hypothetical protein
MLQIVCKLLHTPAGEQNLLQTVHKLLHSVAPSWNCFTSCWRLDVSTTIFSTSYDCFRHISTLSTTFDRFRHFAARITLESAVQRPKTSVVEHKGCLTSCLFLACSSPIPPHFHRQPIRRLCLPLVGRTLF